MWLVVDTLDTLVVVSTSASGLWRIPVGGSPALLARILGAILAVLGVAFAGLSGYALLVALLTIAFGHYYIVRLEEPFLEKVFGDEYIEYKRRVPRYLRLSL